MPVNNLTNAWNENSGIVINGGHIDNTSAAAISLNTIVGGGGASIQGNTNVLAGSINLRNAGNGFNAGWSSVFAVTNNSDAAAGTPDTSISRTNQTASGAAVIAIGNGTANNASGFLNWGGQARVTANATSTTTTMTAVPGMVVNVSTGRTYMFEVNLFTTATTVGGIKAAMSGSAAWTNIRYEGSVLENNTVGGYVVAAAITTNVATLTAAATGFVTIKGLGTVSTAGTLTVNFGQNATAAGATTIQSGSYMIVHDMP